MTSPLHKTATPAHLATESRSWGDRPVYDDDILPPSTHEDRARMIVGSPMPALLALLDDAIKHDRVDLLQTALRIGTFSLAREVERDDRALHTVAAANAVAQFLNQTTLEKRKTDPVLGDLEEEVRILTTNASDEFTSFFAEFGRHLVIQCRAIVEQNFASIDPSTRGAIDKSTLMPETCKALMLKVLVGAIALDDASLAGDIVAQMPGLMHEPLPADLLSFGDPFAGIRVAADEDNEPDLFACPAYLTLEFNRPACLETMRAVLKEEPPFALHIKPSPEWCRLPLGQKGNVAKKMGFIDCVSVLAHANSAIRAMPSLLSAEMGHSMALPTYNELNANALFRAAMLGMEGGGHRLFNNFAGFDAHKVYAIDPTSTVLQAIRFGHPDRVLVDGEVDWARVFSPDLNDNSFEKGMVAAIKTHKPHRYEQAMVNAIGRACDNGFAHLAAQQHPKINAGVHSNDSDYRMLPATMAVPLAYFLVENFNQALIALVKAGMDPTKPSLDGGSTPIEDADKVSPECAHTLRTLSTRRRALAALEEMDAESSPSKGRAP